MLSLRIIPVPAFSDNYFWLVHDELSGDTAVVDPGDAAPVLAKAKELGWTINQIWNTHWHRDHTGGNLDLKAATGATVLGPQTESIPGRDIGLREGDELRIGGIVGRVMEVPGHTSGHIALVFNDQMVAFVGDTLFAMGCGRLFEGSPEQMYHSLERLASLPPETSLFCAHEYTLANAEFAARAEPRNVAIADRLARVRQQRAEGRITLPTTVGEERETNPFVRATNAVEFARLRKEKDSFRS